MATPRRMLPTSASSSPSRKVAVIAGEKVICMTSVNPAMYARPMAGVAKVDIVAGTRRTACPATAMTIAATPSRAERPPAR